VVTGTSAAESSVRSFLLSEVSRFVKFARRCPGVRRIALVGSLTTDKRDPKDADVLVTVDDDADLTALATAGRRLKGRAQSRSKGADIFLADPSGALSSYLPLARMSARHAVACAQPVDVEPSCMMILAP
jgi:predicted nucleotidyltransferase